MKQYVAWLAGASLAYGSPHVFSVTDDLLAYPQYEVVFAESYISDQEASSILALPSSTTTDRPSQHSHDASISSSPSSELTHAPPNDPSNISPEAPASYERMILDSTPYLCSVPSPPPPNPQNTTASHLAAEEETSEIARATDRGWDLLREMTGSCLFYISGWWSYEFCYAKSVKQFHPRAPGGNVPLYPPVEDPTTASYVLGRFGEKKVNRHRLPGGGGSLGGALDGGLPPEDGEEGSTTTIQAKGSSSSRYLSQKLSGGTLCDLTGSPRRVEIQFHCHPQSADRIGWIKEVSTCSYLMVVYTPRLCNDAAFLPEREEKAEQVICREVVREEDEAAWRRRKSQEAAKKLIGETESVVKGGATGKPMVGNMEVGGMKHVGGDKGWLQTPDTNIDLNGLAMKLAKEVGNSIAHQHKKEEGGAVHKLSDREIKQLGVDVKLAKAAIKEMKSAAKGKGWKLEAYETDGRMEMRGVWDKEDGEEGEEGGVDIVIVEADEERQVEGTEEGYRDEL